MQLLAPITHTVTDFLSSTLGSPPGASTTSRWNPRLPSPPRARDTQADGAGGGLLLREGSVLRCRLGVAVLVGGGGCFRCKLGVAPKGFRGQLGAFLTAGCTE